MENNIEISQEEIKRNEKLFDIAYDLLEKKNKDLAENQPNLSAIDGLGVSLAFSALVLAQYLKFLVNSNPEYGKDEILKKILINVSDLALKSAKIDLESKDE